MIRCGFIGQSTWTVFGYVSAENEILDILRLCRAKIVKRKYVTRKLVFLYASTLVHNRNSKWQIGGFQISIKPYIRTPAQAIIVLVTKALGIYTGIVRMT